ncbi:helix-turn-helix transcriptional regulator [Micromonospora sp. NPDC006766]|uniref:helix-turn-helix domain-containing protein n=1 Tax=Micromonospora sp. NPDC006766 TaxID=3154778 RepID=UPI0033FCBF49
MSGPRRGGSRVPDYHPDDRTNRLRVAAELVAVRKQAGLSWYSFGAKVGRAKATVQSMEERGYWTVGTLQRWARWLDHRFVWTLHLPYALAPDALADMYAAKITGTADVVDAYARAGLVNDMRRAREGAGLTQKQLGERLDVSHDTICRAERIEDNLDLAAAQRHVRGCGGWLEPRIEPLETA